MVWAKAGRSSAGFRGFRVCQDPKEPTCLGFLVMISLHKSLKRVGSLGFRVPGFGKNLTVGGVFLDCLGGF